MCVCNLTNAKEWLYIAENKMKITKENVFCSLFLFSLFFTVDFCFFFLFACPSCRYSVRRLTWQYGGGCGWGERRYVEGSLRAAVLKILETLGASENFRFRLQCNWAGVSGYCNWVRILG
ncbi:hypothetical protein ES288_D08G140800v1 [Gossypium darwinii]|uniref:Uncharacterized protein n=1 Tax=Gossypium darwinii TaxID=34276 RepID=A0A5D2BJD1_GOSDA|nr:hypothetical protein ES288_D08G140800v1 [Gossypium darwinii]